MHLIALVEQAVQAGARHAPQLAAKFAAAALFVLACVGLAVVGRSLARRARTEEVEELLRDEFAGLEDAARRKARNARKRERRERR